MQIRCYLHKNSVAPCGSAPSYPATGTFHVPAAAQMRINAAGFAHMAFQSAARCRFARQYLYRLIVSRLARAGVIMSGALTPIDVLSYAPRSVGEVCVF